MTGGDMRIQMNQGLTGTKVPGGSQLQSLTVDANSVKSGNMTERRQVKDSEGQFKEVFLTPDGAKLFDVHAPQMPFVNVESDPGAIRELFKRIFVGGPREQGGP